ncbi:zonular occludens toxin domain-containing protein [Luteimonas salinilitoris]|uniref:Zonular occludens toxin domain-containing protein n=1 Tax=Luteimonas salinilitoris TaxID=3237697 RepID=A0ABV4HVW8_9GAMM
MSTPIGQTASITLLTALPGSGKTLRIVQFIKEANDAGERVFVTNLNGLKLPHIPFEDPRQWQDIPAGSVLVVDEAQKFFRTRRGGDAPDYITAMETIRHEGVRLVLATQQPDYLDSHLRGLVGLHEHLVREDGKEASTIYRHVELMENVRSSKARSRYDHETWAFPKELYALYDSAQVHTVKRVVKSRVKRGIILAAVALTLFVGSLTWVSGLWGGSSDAKAEATPAPAGPVTAGQGPGLSSATSSQLTARQAHEPEALDEYFARLRARTPSMPWTAPIFDDRPVVSEPRVYCMISGHGYEEGSGWSDGGCTCLTEQGSRYNLGLNECTRLARYGMPYNPYRQEVQAQEAAGVAEPSPALAPPPTVGGGTVGTAPRPHLDPEFGTMTRPTLGD